MHISVTTTIFATLCIITRCAAQLEFTSWDGNACDGDQMPTLPCNGGCNSFSGEHSYEISLPGQACITFFEEANCLGESFLFSDTAVNGCINVNTGTDVESYICSAC
ncbi:hypothetical protein BDP27DRAFT_1271547 [Rhodocollybia butyracea]|uniref:Uncharacterized protein n=1 Tax=Rhodocollybia butyracea TaxID=206335 RepID=A0A9P5U1N0_9AGAR|nr:hypothetical protein BDP27DRAFT_1271547 [Rhodocollybia butyracea]